MSNFIKHNPGIEVGEAVQSALFNNIYSDIKEDQLNLIDL